MNYLILGPDRAKLSLRQASEDMSQNYFVSRNIEVNVFSLSSVLQHTPAKFSTLLCLPVSHLCRGSDINLSGEERDQGRYLQ